MKAQVILVRFQSTIYAFALSCPHEQAAVKWDPKEARFQCTKHKSRYTPDGTYTSGRATRNMDRFPVRRDGDAVLVTTTSVFRSDQNPTGWKGASLALLAAAVRRATGRSGRIAGIMRTRLALAALAVATTAVFGYAHQSAPLKSGVLAANMDTTVRPQDDFFRYVNGGWLKTHRDSRRSHLYRLVRRPARRGRAQCEDADRGGVPKSANRAPGHGRPADWRSLRQLYERGDGRESRRVADQGRARQDRRDQDARRTRAAHRRAGADGHRRHEPRRLARCQAADDDDPGDGADGHHAAAGPRLLPQG